MGIEIKPTLKGFVRHFLSLDFGHMTAREFYDYGSVLSLVLYREPPFQAELFILRPNAGFPRDHRHPHVDSFEYVLSDSVPLIVNGRRARDCGEFLRNADNRAVVGNLGELYEVGAEDWHAVGDIPAGGSFLSIQHWTGVTPTSVGKNWEGSPVSKEHWKILCEPDSVWIKTNRKEIYSNLCQAALT